MKQIIFTFLLFISASLAHAKMTVTFKSNVTLKNDVLLVSDLIEDDQTELDFIKRYGRLVVAEGEEIPDTLSRARLFSFLLQHKADMNDLHFRGQSAIHVERGQLVQLSKDSLAKIARTISVRFNIPVADLQIDTVKILPRLESENSQQDLLIRHVKIDDAKRFQNTKLSAIIADATGREHAYQIFAKVTVDTSVLQPKRDIAAGETFNIDDFIIGRKNVESLESRLLRPLEIKKQAFKLIRDLKKDQVITLDDVRPSTLVNEGKLVTLSYKNEHIHISTMGKLHTEGEVGQIVRVENLDSKRLVSGRLISPDSVEVIHEP